ncbi:MAG TPA: hypothetical protein DEV93_07145 [Chloroflexi bacterium]|jgi:hypothetical protein|nr:hypothetical protein [Chloroflexota bacterium]
MRTIRLAAVVILGFVLMLALFGTGHSVRADNQPATHPTATPGSISTNGTNPRVTIPITGSGGTASNSGRGLSRLPRTGGGGSGTSILPSLLLALLGIFVVIAGRSLRGNRR